MSRRTKPNTQREVRATIAAALAERAQRLDAAATVEPSERTTSPSGTREPNAPNATNASA
jgi:hypothetical protein